MPDIVFVAIGLVAGLAVGWFLASSRSRPGMVKQLAETKVRGARAVEVMKQEVTVELARRDSELAEARTKLEHELHNVAKMQAEVKYAFDQKVQLGAELQAVVDESFREIGQLYEIGSSLEAAVQAVEARLLAATKRLREMGIAAGVPGSVSVGASAEPERPEQPQTADSAGAVSEAVRVAGPPQRTPVRTDSALPTRRAGPGGPGRPHATR